MFRAVKMARAGVRLSEADLRRIVAKALSFWERAPAQVSGGDKQPMSSTIEKRLRDWIRVVADGDVDVFRRRLAMEGLDLAHARLLLADVPPDIDIPRWASVLNDLLDAATAGGAKVTAGSAEFAFLSATDPVPFEDLLAPFVCAARHRLNKACDGRFDRLATAARTACERALLLNLSDMAARVLLVEFRAFKASNQYQISGAKGGLTSNESAEGDDRRNYRSFVAEFGDAGWAGIFRDYPALARILAFTFLHWLDSTGEFLRRLDQDLVEIRRKFFSARDIGDVIALQPSLSDPHNGGRTVVIVTFAPGARVVYKPNSQQLEAAYLAFLAWLEEQGCPIRLRGVEVVNRGRYGWAEFIENRPCAARDDAHVYYRRLGGLLCLIYALNGVDMHFENVVACGDEPIPIDLETIYHPVLPIEQSDDVDLASARLRHSVLRAHILPNPVKLHDGYYDISVIGRSPDNQRPVKMLKWAHINADAMNFAPGEAPSPVGGNTPRFADHSLSATPFVSDMLRGFEDMYRFLLTRREHLLGADSPLNRMFACPARLLFRATGYYQSVLNKALNPSSLQDGADFAIQLDVLARSRLKSPFPEAMSRLLHAETRALLQGDIPKFSARGVDTSVALASGETIENCFPVSARDAVAAKLRDMGQADLDLQIKVIKGAMDAHGMRAIADEGEHVDRQEKGGEAPDLTNDELTFCACDIARELKSSALMTSGGEPSWLVLDHLPEAGQFALRAIGDDLYNGRCGIALFFAALAHCRSEPRYRSLAYATLAPVRRRLGIAQRNDIEKMGLGGLIGFPSLIYSLVRIGAFLGDEQLLSEARKAASKIEDATIESDTKLDLVGGVAGAILCLLAVHETDGGADWLDKATRCGRRLLAQRVAHKSGARIWATFAHKHLTGFSHGSTGIAYALLRLAEKTHDADFLAAAKEALVFEDAEFEPSQNNWPDRRQGATDTIAAAAPKFKVAWCNGAPGIGLARLQELHVLDSPFVRRDIAAALETCDRGLLERDHICCGNFGLVETLLVAGRKLQAPEWTNRARRLASQVVARAKSKGAFAVAPENGFPIPSLFQGAAGVGYELLRLTRPDEVPSVLALE